MTTQNSQNSAPELISKKRSDYKAPSHTFTRVDLQFDLDPDETRVKGTYVVKRLDTKANAILLDGEKLELVSVSINGQQLQSEQDYIENDTSLEIFSHLDEFELCIENKISPQNNTSLEGLYFSNNAYCTQCEAQGFRKIIYFLDRPDVLATFRVTIIDKNPNNTYLLSNGNLVSDSGFVDGRRICVWEDPYPKPCYLFALVAGHFDKLDDYYVTALGRKVALELFVDEGRKHQGQHALTSLKNAMKWDEENYGLEYDLDIYMVVAVDFFNMGAMENKGLNVFNSKFVLAEPTTATDEDYFNIESIIAHEYFHNWTGNRVTCRDWFQLSLKEGLTVFRDQQFSADMYSRLVTRINQVKVIREHQFAEDASPMSHPIRPEEVLEMNNFYTVTVYDKGAEVIRMLHTLLGKDGFRKGMDLYFDRHDGQAVTCDDFVLAMQDANEHNLSHFKRWYSQSGTPEIDIVLDKQRDEMCSLRFTQKTAATRDQSEKHPLYIPIKLECFDQKGQKIDLSLPNDTFVLESEQQSLNIASSDITPSILQDFSAPVKINYEHSLSDLLIIVEHASNHYAKWEAIQSVYTTCIKQIYQSLVTKTDDFTLLENAIQNVDAIIRKIDVPNEVEAELLSVPSSESLLSNMSGIQPLLLEQAREIFVAEYSQALASYCQQQYYDLNTRLLSIDYAYEKQQVNDRKLKNVCLEVIAIAAKEQQNSEAFAMVKEQYEIATNMTDKLAAIKVAQVSHSSLFNSLMLSFEKEYIHDAVVMDKWFALHAKDPSNDVLAKLDLLKAHKLFAMNNPNKVRSLIGTFAFYNIKGFHQPNGSGYKYLVDNLFELDAVNPQVASRLLTPLIQFSSFDELTQNNMKIQLQRLFGKKDLSKDLFEKISKAIS